MHEDLNRYFNLTDTVKWIERKYLVLFIRNSSLTKKAPSRTTRRNLHFKYIEYISASPNIIASDIAIYGNPNMPVIYKGPKNERLKLISAKKSKTLKH